MDTPNNGPKGGAEDVVRKAVACLLRPGRNGLQLLVFTHPNGTVQIPKGTLEEGESAEEAALRELEEETGISDAAIDARVVDLERIVPRGPAGAGPLEAQLWHVLKLRARPAGTDAWHHEASGSAEEEGLVFSCRWLDLSGAEQRVDELYHPVLVELLEAVS